MHNKEATKKKDYTDKTFRLLRQELYPLFCLKHGISLAQFNFLVETDAEPIISFQRKVYLAVQEVNKCEKPKILDYEV